VQTTRGRTDWTQLFFSSSGRVGRGPFLVAVAVLLAVLVLYDNVVFGFARMMTAWVVLSVLLFSALCVVSKRMHDRGRSGWWSALVLLSFWIVWPGPHGFFDFLWALVLVWAAVELGVIGGEQGANRYGPPPVA
jgi:uncharacterized membrane protein YhaH (DUF805 family)